MTVEYATLEEMTRHAEIEARQLAHMFAEHYKFFRTMGASADGALGCTLTVAMQLRDEWLDNLNYGELDG